MSPRLLFRTVARAEAVTWALLLVGMFLKHVTETTELGVRVFGMLHGVVFVAYVLTAVLVAVDRPWGWRRTASALVAAVPPFFTLLFERHLERTDPLTGTWRLRSDEPSGPIETVAAWLLRNPLAGAVAGLAAVAGLTLVALVVGPPTA